MNNVEMACEELKKQILDLPETKEFLRLKDLISKDDKIQAMRREIAKLESEGKTKERDNLLEEYNSIPLINNYNIMREEIYSILKEISDILK